MTRETEIAKFAKHYAMPKREARRLFVAYERKPANYRRVIEIEGDPKTVKGNKHGYLTGIIYFAPANLSGYEMCAGRTANCTEVCLGPTSGHGQFTNTQEARIRKTVRWVEDRANFLAAAKHDAFRLMRQAAKRKLKPAGRPNGASDQPKLAKVLAQAFPWVKWYDYTKLDKPWLRLLPNYSLTFSYSGENMDACQRAMAHGINVSVVFSRTIPAMWNGRRVIDGTEHDLRFLDEAGVIVGLLAKGAKAKADTNNKFVILQ